MAKLIPLPEKYTIPNNWKWIEIGALTSMRTGFPFDSKKFSTECYNRKPLIRIRDVVRGSTKTFTDEECPDDYVIHSGDILIGMDGDFNVAKWKSEDALLNQRVCCIQSKSATLLNDYLFYYLPDPLKKINDVTPSVTVKHLSTKTLEQTLIPLPPLAEQQRIVDHIESLFAKLDEAKEKAQAVIDGYEDRKAAILHKAFGGELTAEWRKENGIVSDGSWKMHPLGEYANSQYGYTEKASAENVGPHFLRITDIQDGQVFWKSVPYCKIDSTLKDKYALSVGDIVVARTGATTGKSYMVVDAVEAVYASYLIRVTIHRKELLRSKFLYYYFQCPLYWRQITELSSGIAQPGVNGNKLKTLLLPVPNVEEQDEIINRLDHLLPKERLARDSAELLLDQIDTMKKSILARAFRGELGTNNPNDEPAIEFLKSIL